MLKRIEEGGGGGGGAAKGVQQNTLGQCKVGSSKTNLGWLQKVAIDYNLKYIHISFASNMLFILTGTIVVTFQCIVHILQLL